MGRGDFDESVGKGKQTKFYFRPRVCSEWDPFLSRRGLLTNKLNLEGSCFKPACANFTVVKK
jgi:hypothetical protein